MKLKYEELFEPYTADGHTLESMVKFLKSEANQRGISTDVMEIALLDIFSGIHGGKTYSKTSCSCGCGLTESKAGTELIHFARKRMLELNDAVLAKSKEILQDRVNLLIKSQITRVTTDLLNSEMPYRPWKETVLSKYFKFMNFKRSPVLNFIKKIKNGN